MPKHVKPAMEPRLYSVKQSAAYMNATVWFVRSLIWNRRIPFVKFGNRLLLDRKDLDAYIDAQKVAAM
jgi:excisionase family DNA binding protein